MHESFVKKWLFLLKSLLLQVQIAMNLQEHSLCNGMLNLKFPVTMETSVHLKIAKNYCFVLIFSIKTDSKVLQLLTELR
jgi:hypothetical protein